MGVMTVLGLGRSDPCRVPEEPQRDPVGRDGQAGVQEKTRQPRLANGPQSLSLPVKGEIERRGILNSQDHRVLGHPLHRGGPVGGQNRRRGDTRIGEKPIRSFRHRPRLTRLRNRGLGMVAEALDQLEQPLGEPRIAKVSVAHFGDGPQHDLAPSSGRRRMLYPRAGGLVCALRFPLDVGWSGGPLCDILGFRRALGKSFEETLFREIFLDRYSRNDLWVMHGALAVGRFSGRRPFPWDIPDLHTPVKRGIL